MKRTFKNIVAILALPLAGAMIQSCEVSDFGDTNVSPNATTTPVTAALLTNSLAQIGGVYASQGMYAQYISESQYTDISRYTAQEYNFAEYSGVLYDLENIIINNTDAKSKVYSLNFGSNVNQIAIARILKAYYFWRTTDMLGDIPYSQALKGNPKPAYDSQQSIYTALFAELDAAVKQMENGGAAIKGDILFSGNMTRWKKFANSIRLIMALRVSKADAALGSAQAKAALAADGGVFTTNAESAILTYAGGAFQNPWFARYNGRKDEAISEPMVTNLNALSDPRLPAFGQPGKTGKVTGIPYGVSRDKAVAFTNANPEWSFVLTADLRKDNSQLALISAADVFLARAEAAQLGWTSENAKDMYNAGIKASLEFWKVFNQAAYDDYIASAPVAFGANDALTKIRLQRWITFFPNGWQGWSEWRRTGVPDLKPSPDAVNSSKQIPRRHIYVANEASLNPEAYNGAVAKFAGGLDTQDGRVWWDKQ
jgi:hypothetical protein